MSEEYNDELQGYLWHENDSVIKRKGSFTIEGTKYYGAIVESKNNLGESKYEFMMSLGLIHLNGEKLDPKSPDMGGKVTHNGKQYKLMSDDIVESWQDKIRSMSPNISAGEYELIKCDADIKRLQARLELQAAANGHKTINAQKNQADNSDELYQARLRLGVAKGALAGLKIELKALETGFEEWRTKMVNMREEKKRYGA